MQRSSFDFLLGALVALVFAQTPAHAQNMLNPDNVELSKGAVVNDAERWLGLSEQFPGFG